MVMVMVMVRLGGQALWERLWFGFVGKVMVWLRGKGYGLVGGQALWERLWFGFVGEVMVWLRG